MKSRGSARIFGGGFAIALLFYAAAFYFIEHVRSRHGPWIVTFTSNASGAPQLIINQPRLGISNVCLVFPATNSPGLAEPVTLAFERPRPVPFELPYGSCPFIDTTSLPGTVVFDLFGHQIQLMPRVLTIDHRERPWRSGDEIPLAVGQ